MNSIQVTGEPIKVTFEPFWLTHELIEVTPCEDASRGVLRSGFDAFIC